MNNKGQTLVLFVALLPFIFILFVFVFDLAFLSSEKTKLDSIASSSLRSIVMENKDIELVKDNIRKNDSSIVIDEIYNNSICLSKKVKPIFGGIIGYDIFNIKTCLEGNIVNSKLIIEKKGK